MIINHNVSSLNTLDRINNTGLEIKKSLEKLSSGLRIVSADDDASGLAISESMRAQINGLGAAKLNAQQGLSALKIVEGTLNQQQQILQRMNTLAVRASDSLTGGGALMQSEVVQLASEYDRLGSLGVALSGNLQVGASAGGANVISVAITAASFATSSIDVSSTTTASSSITSLSAAIDALSASRGTVGALMNRLNNTIQTIGVQIQNTTAAESAIRDVDMAAEMSNFQRLQILQQSGMAMLAQANSQPQSVLSLLR